MKAEFKIFKAGRTKSPVTISSMDGKTAGGQPFDKAKKMEFYRSLGYQVTEL